MTANTHYYVLCLGAKTSTLYEAFRDYLIEVENQGFPVVSTIPYSGEPDDPGLKVLMRTVDESFDHYYSIDPLQVVAVGEERMRSAFQSVTTHHAAIIGWIEGDHTATSPRDLGQIVWPEVRRSISGVSVEALEDLRCADPGNVASGLEAVIRVVSRRVRATLVVEDGYHVRGGIGGTREAPVLCPEVDVRAVMDDAIDGVIESVLECGGKVVFTPPGTLGDRKQIVVMLHQPKCAGKPGAVL